MDLLVTCACGHRMTVSEYAAGMTAPCPACGKPLTVSPENSKPAAPTAGASPQSAAAPSVPTEIAYTPMQTASLKTHCARCGREFRGDWDRHPSTAGLVCNICRNLVAADKEAMTSSGYVAPIDSIHLDPVLDPRPPVPVEVEEVELTWREKYMPDEAMLQRIAIGAAVAFGLYTVWLFISGAWVVPPDPDDAETAAAAVAAADVPKLPMWTAVAMTVLSTGSGFISTFAGIYAFLTLSHRLPEDTFLANAVRLFPAALLITALYFAASILPVPFIGVLVTLVFVPAVLFVFFGFEAQDIVNFPLGMALGGVLQFMSYILIYWVIAGIAL